MGEWRPLIPCRDDAKSIPPPPQCRPGPRHEMIKTRTKILATGIERITFNEVIKEEITRFGDSLDVEEGERGVKDKNKVSGLDLEIYSRNIRRKIKSGAYSARSFPSTPVLRKSSVSSSKHVVSVNEKEIDIGNSQIGMYLSNTLLIA
ncbi:unnamed protein product [Caretta caretta]